MYIAILLLEKENEEIERNRNKNRFCGEGGMLAVKNEAIYNRLRCLRSYGLSQPTNDNYKGRAISYDVELPRLNYRIEEIRSTLGLVELGMVGIGGKTFCVLKFANMLKDSPNMSGAVFAEK